MTSVQRDWGESAGAILWVAAVLAVLLGSNAVRAGAQPGPILRVGSNSRGEIEIDARGVQIEEALDAIASKAGFEVVIQPGLVRPPVDVAVSMTAVEDVLRQVMRGRNYALVYDAGDDAFLSQVIVLPPPGFRTQGPASRRQPRSGNWRVTARNR